VDLTNVTIDGNTAAVSGGGLYLEQTSYTTLSGCTIQNNTSGVAAPGIAFEMGASLTGADTCTFGDPNQEPTQV
jgi:parallel beta-helix repeat protein